MRGARGPARGPYNGGVSYLQWLIVISISFIVLERLLPWRKEQRLLREGSNLYRATDGPKAKGQMTLENICRR